MVSAIGTTSTAAAQAASSTAAQPGVNADFNTFLTMLTAQLKNQDPLNPMEGTEFAVQLATFSSVEQQAQTNKLLTLMTSQMGGEGLAQAADLIGKQAQTTAPVWFGDTALTLDIAPDMRADDVALVALNGNGQEVGRELIGLGAGHVEWFGRDMTGQKLPDGQYRFRIENLRDGEVISDADVPVYARVNEARLEDGETMLIFEGGTSVPLAAIRALREGAAT